MALWIPEIISYGIISKIRSFMILGDFSTQNKLDESKKNKLKNETSDHVWAPEGPKSPRSYTYGSTDRKWPPQSKNTFFLKFGEFLVFLESKYSSGHFHQTKWKCRRFTILGKKITQHTFFFCGTIVSYNEPLPVIWATNHHISIRRCIVVVVLM